LPPATQPLLKDRLSRTIAPSASQPNIATSKVLRAKIPTAIIQRPHSRNGGLVPLHMTSSFNDDSNAPAGNSGSNIIKAALVQKGATSNRQAMSHHAELKIKRAAEEAEALAQKLDESETIKYMQQLEISRLKSQMNRMSSPVKTVVPRLISKQNTDINKSVTSSVFVGSQRLESSGYPDEMLTNADLHGVPSQSDLNQMRISSAKGNSHAITPNSREGRQSKLQQSQASSQLTSGGGGPLAANDTAGPSPVAPPIIIKAEMPAAEGRYDDDDMSQNSSISSHG
jgi:hypothetical protein